MPEKEEVPVEKPQEEPESKKDEEGTKENGTESEEKKEPEEPAREMRAVVLTGFGGLKSVKLQKKPEPTITDGEILVRVAAW
ncbi:hypothetical protein B566_EDAN004403 [Ephemera danica]|nr:hypothetical protein B566_EDAN004403 [Ephemera danica]